MINEIELVLAKIHLYVFHTVGIVGRKINCFLVLNQILSVNDITQYPTSCKL